MTTQRGFRLATSTGCTLTGRGGNIIIIDDPLKPADAHSDARRLDLQHWYSNTLLSRQDDKNAGAIVLVMQRLHIDDLAGYLMDQEGWEVLSLSAIADREQGVPIQTYSKFDPLATAPLLNAGHVASVAEFMPFDDYLQGRFYREWARPQGWLDSANAVIEKSGTSSTVLRVVTDKDSRHSRRRDAPANGAGRAACAPRDSGRKVDGSQACRSGDARRSFRWT